MCSKKPKVSTWTPADDKPKADVPACTCGTAFFNSHGRRCVDCAGKPSAAQIDAVREKQGGGGAHERVGVDGGGQEKKPPETRGQSPDNTVAQDDAIPPDGGEGEDDPPPNSDPRCAATILERRPGAVRAEANTHERTKTTKAGCRSSDAWRELYADVGCEGDSVKQIQSGDRELTCPCCDTVLVLPDEWVLVYDPPPRRVCSVWGPIQRGRNIDRPAGAVLLLCRGERVPRD